MNEVGMDGTGLPSARQHCVYSAKRVNIYVVRSLASCASIGRLYCESVLARSQTAPVWPHCNYTRIPDPDTHRHKRLPIQAIRHTPTTAMPVCKIFLPV